MRAAATLHSLRLLRRQPCKGSPAAQTLAHAGPGGHALVTDGVLIWCRQCGSWTQGRLLGLGLPCPPRGPTRAGRDALSRLAKGRHPRKDAWIGLARALLPAEVARLRRELRAAPAGP